MTDELLDLLLSSDVDGDDAEQQDLRPKGKRASAAASTATASQPPTVNASKPPFAAAAAANKPQITSASISHPSTSGISLTKRPRDDHVGTYATAVKRATTAKPPPPPTSNLISANTTIAPSKREEFLERHSGLYVKNRLVSSSLMSERMRTRGNYSLTTLGSRPKTDLDKDFVTFGVVVARPDVRDMAKGGKYALMKLSRLDSLSAEQVPVMMFGACYQTHWKLSLGTVVALLNPQVLPPANKSATPALKLDNEKCLMVMGQSVDYGHCQAMRRDGTPCTNAINRHLYQYCSHHVSNIKLSVNNNRPNLASSVHTSNKQQRTGPQTGVYYVNGGLISAAGSAPAKTQNQQLLQAQQAREQATLQAFMKNSIVGSKYIQMTNAGVRQEHADVLTKRNTESASTARPKPLTDLRTLFKPKSMNEVELEDEPMLPADENTKRVIAMIRERGVSFKKPDPNRPHLSAPAVTQESIDRLKKQAEEVRRSSNIAASGKDPIGAGRFEAERQLEKQKSAHAKQRAKQFGIDLDSEEARRRLAALDRQSGTVMADEEYRQFLLRCAQLEGQEKVAEKRAAAYETKVDAWYCRECGKVRQTPMQRCRDEGHTLSKRRVSKYTWRCAGCKAPAEVYQSSLPPTRDCRQCNVANWVPNHRVQSDLAKDVNKVLPRGFEHAKFLTG